MAGSKKSYLVITIVIITIISLAFLVKDSQAGFQFQTVPTEKPTQTAEQVTQTQAPIIQPTAVNSTPAPTSVETQSGNVNATAVLTSTTSASEPSTPASIITQTATVNGPTETIASGQPDPGTDTAPDSRIKTIYFLICGLSLVVAIVIIVILATHKASKGPKPPPQG